MDFFSWLKNWTAHSVDSQIAKSTGMSMSDVYNATDKITGSSAAMAGGPANQEQAYNSAEAQKDRDFQEYMSSTQIQRSMQDYQKAGLNPWLAVQNGYSGAAMAGGAQATSNTRTAAQDLKDGITSAASLAVILGSIIKAVVK